MQPATKAATRRMNIIVAAQWSTLRSRSQGEGGGLLGGRFSWPK